MMIFVVDLKNQPGELSHVCDALAQRGVNIYLAGVSWGDHGLLGLVADDEAAARAALNEAKIPFTEHAALRVTISDRPGEAARMAQALAEAHVNIDCLIPTSICQGKATLAVSVDKMDEARRALGDMVA